MLLASNRKNSGLNYFLLEKWKRYWRLTGEKAALTAFKRK